MTNPPDITTQGSSKRIACTFPPSFLPHSIMQYFCNHGEETELCIWKCNLALIPSPQLLVILS